MVVEYEDDASVFLEGFKTASKPVQYKAIVDMRIEELLAMRDGYDKSKFVSEREHPVAGYRVVRVAQDGENLFLYVPQTEKDENGKDIIKITTANISGQTLSPDTWAGVLVIDELTQAPPRVQNMLGPLFYERRISDFQYSDEVRIIVTGNTPDDNTGSYEEKSFITDRVEKYIVEVDKEYLKYFLEKREKHLHKVIFDMLKRKQNPALLRSGSSTGSFDISTGKLRDPESTYYDAKNRIGPSPRGWEYLSEMLRECGTEYTKERAYAIVGAQAAEELNIALEVYGHIPNIMDVFDGGYSKSKVDKFVEKVFGNEALSDLAIHLTEDEIVKNLSSLFDSAINDPAPEISAPTLAIAARDIITAFRSQNSVSAGESAMMIAFPLNVALLNTARTTKATMSTETKASIQILSASLSAMSNGNKNAFQTDGWLKIEEMAFDSGSKKEIVL